MKKLYFLATTLIYCGSAISQTEPTVLEKDFQKAVLPLNIKPAISKSTERSLGTKYWIDPVEAIMTTNGIDLTGSTSTPSQNAYLSGIFQDSTVTLSSSSGTTSAINSILLGSVFDPKSPFLDPSGNYTPLLSSSEAYSIDSLQIIGSYVKIDPNVTDTLYTWLVWGDTANTAVFTKKATNLVWVAPISTWRTYVIGAKINGAVAAAGNKVSPAAPAGNKILIKYVLGPDDEAIGAGYSKVISIALPTIADIPAGNIVSCFYTFVPGSSYVAGDCAYSLPGAPVSQTINGFAGLVWNQSFPVVAALSDFQNQQVDAGGYNMGASYDKKQRHSISTSATSSKLRMSGNLLTSPLIYYSFYSNSSVGIHDINSNFSLSQNTPNPFTNQTKINYQIKTAAKNIALEIYNIAGVKMFEKTQTNLNAGNYSVNVNDVNFSAGIYFYSLIVDGNKTTKKMIVTN